MADLNLTPSIVNDNELPTTVKLTDPAVPVESNIFGDATETINPNTSNTGIEVTNGGANVISYMPDTTGANSIGLSVWIKVSSSLSANAPAVYIEDTLGSPNNKLLSIEFINSGSRFNIIVTGANNSKKSSYTQTVTRDVWYHYYIYVENLNSTSFLTILRNGVNFIDTNFFQDNSQITTGLGSVQTATLSNPNALSSKFIGSVSDAYFSLNPNFKDYLNDYYTNSIPTLADTNSLNIVPETIIPSLFARPDYTGRELFDIVDSRWKNGATQGQGKVGDSIVLDGINDYFIDV